MSYRKIDYMEWARNYMSKVRLDLARSNIKSVTKGELAFPADAFDFSIQDPKGYPPLIERLSKRYGVGPERIAVCNGASSGIALACSAVLSDGDEVLLESPNYEPIYRNALHEGASVKMLDRTFDRAWQLSLEELERKITKRTRAVLMTNAHNPSGTVTSPEKMLTIGQISRDHGAKVIVSEVYLDSLFQGKPVSCGTQGDAMIAIGSTTKVYGLGGLRVGWVIAAEDVIAKIRVVADYIAAGGISTPSQVVACHALDNHDRLVGRCKTIVQGNLKIIGDWVKKRGDLAWVEPDAGTVALLKLPTGVDAMALSNHLREKHSTLVVPGDFFWLKGFVRISLGIEEETLKAGLKNVGTAIDQMKSSLR